MTPNTHLKQNILFYFFFILFFFFFFIFFFILFYFILFYFILFYYFFVIKIEFYLLIYGPIDLRHYLQDGRKKEELYCNLFLTRADVRCMHLHVQVKDSLKQPSLFI